MGRFLAAAVLALAALQCALADEKPSEDSLRELIAVTGGKKLVDGVFGQVDAMMQKSTQEALAGRQVTADQQRILDDMRAKALALFKDTVGWETLEPMIIEIYAKTFTQQEIDGMLKFYKSESGQAVIAKLPLVMQHSMTLMQNRMQVLMPKLQELQQETVAELSAAASKKPSGT
jgi:hypothetical protein